MDSASATLSQPPTRSARPQGRQARQQGAWSSGDYAVVGTTLQIVGEELCEALDIRSDQKVLDVATATPPSPPRGAGAMLSPPTTFPHLVVRAMYTYLSISRAAL